jgi:hypothetical protein
LKRRSEPILNIFLIVGRNSVRISDPTKIGKNLDSPRCAAA